MKGILLLFKGISLLFKGLISFLVVIRPFFTRFYILFYVVWKFLTAVFQGESINEAAKQLALLLFGAELNIRNNVLLALENPQMFNIGHLIDIIGSVLLLFFFAKLLAGFFVGVMGAQARLMAFVGSFIIIGIIEIPAIFIMTGEFGFFPIKDGLLFLFFNADKVITAALPFLSGVIPNIPTEISTNTTTNITQEGLNNTNLSG